MKNRVIGMIELSTEAVRGRRMAKFVLHEIYETSEEWNINGISWSEEYTLANMKTVEGMSLKVEFADEERSVPLGHGFTGFAFADGSPIFANAVVVGTFGEASIETLEVDGRTIKGLVAEASIDEFTYPNFVKWLETQRDNGGVWGSVEISPTEPGGLIKYDGVGNGRVPREYNYCGFAVVGASPADISAKMLELNQRMEEGRMNEQILKELGEIRTAMAAGNAAAASVELNTANATIDQLKELLAKTEQERDLHWAKINELEKRIAEMTVDAALVEMNTALAGFDDADKAHAKDLIAANTAKPGSVEVNTIVATIKAAKFDKLAEAQAGVELNTVGGANRASDIFGSVEMPVQNADVGGLY